MGLLDLFKSKEEKKNLSQLKALLLVACADGNFGADELGVICGMMHDKKGVDENVLKKQLEKIEKEGIYGIKGDIVVPETSEEKIEFIGQMVAVMMIDGKIDEDEKKAIRLICEAYKINEEEAEALINLYCNEFEDSEEVNNLKEAIQEAVDEMN